MKQSERKEFQDKFVDREIQVLCACDLLNEGWDCPEINVGAFNAASQNLLEYA